jgi:Protein of unknown function (DUF2953)
VRNERPYCNRYRIGQWTMLMPMHLLATPMSMISILVALCIIILIILLIVPINLSLKFSKKGRLMQGSYKIAWFGLILRNGEILPTSAEDLIGCMIGDKEGQEGDSEARKSNARKSNLGEDKEKEGLEKEATEIEESDFQRPPGLRALIDAFPAITKFLGNLLRSIKFQDISCSLCIGLNDPVQTALMSGYLWSIASMLGLFQANILIEPCFDEEKLEGELSTRFSVRLLWTMVALINVLREGKIRRLLLDVSRRA